MGIDADSVRHVTALAAHNDILATLIYDPMEKALPSSSSLFLSDSIESIDVNSSSDKFQQQFQSGLKQRAEKLTNLSWQHAIPLLSISTEFSVEQQVLEQLGSAASQRRKQ